jgi:hypothetical protein
MKFDENPVGVSLAALRFVRKARRQQRRQQQQKHADGGGAGNSEGRRAEEEDAEGVVQAGQARAELLRIIGTQQQPAPEPEVPGIQSFGSGMLALRFLGKMRSSRRAPSDELSSPSPAAAASPSEKTPILAVDGAGSPDEAVGAAAAPSAVVSMWLSLRNRRQLTSARLSSRLVGLSTQRDIVQQRIAVGQRQCSPLCILPACHIGVIAGAAAVVRRS